jgi:hypothetical protein
MERSKSNRQVYFERKRRVGEGKTPDWEMPEGTPEYDLAYKLRSYSVRGPFASREEANAAQEEMESKVGWDWL